MSNVARVSLDDFDLIEQRPGWWAARCIHCGAWITKYDFTRSDAETLAIKSAHACLNEWSS